MRRNSSTMCSLLYYHALLLLAATSVEFTAAFVSQKAPPISSISTIPSSLSISSISSISSPSSPLRASTDNSDDDTSDTSNPSDHSDPSNSIHVAILNGSPKHDAFRMALKNHPFCAMTGIALSVTDLPCRSMETMETMEKMGEAGAVEIIRQSDIVCFTSPHCVKSYLKSLDGYLDAEGELGNLNNLSDLSAEERRKLPNTLSGDGGGGAVMAVMAACLDTETARECLNSGRWMANHIYYPKGSDAIPLKAELIEDGDTNGANGENGENGANGENGENGEVEIESVDYLKDMEEVSEEQIESWAASVMQAAGDVMERKFWGGGW